MGEMSVKRRRPVIVPDDDKIVEPRSRNLAIEMGLLYLDDDAATRRDDRGANSHSEIIGITIGTTMAISGGRAICLNNVIRRSGGIRQHIGRSVPVGITG